MRTIHQQTGRDTLEFPLDTWFAYQGEPVNFGHSLIDCLDEIAGEWDDLNFCTLEEAGLEGDRENDTVPGAQGAYYREEDITPFHS
jgi:hypothetical protein